MNRFISFLCSSLLFLALLSGASRADVQECIAGQDCLLFYAPFNKNDNSKVTDLSEATADFYGVWKEANTTATAISESTPDNINIYQKGTTSGIYILEILASSNIITSGNAGKTFCVYVSGHSTVDTNKPACVYVKSKTDENTVARMPATGTLATVSDLGAGSTDWTSTEKEHIRYRLGVDGTATAPSTNTPNLGYAKESDYTATRAAKLDNLDTAITTRQPSGNVTVGSYAAGQGPADLVLSTPANKLATDASGRVTVGTNADKTGYSLSAAGVDAILDETVEGSYTMRQLLCMIVSKEVAKASGGDTNTITFRNLGDTVDRVTMTVDASGNRSAVTFNLTGCP